jgi:hypothetical protein
MRQAEVISLYEVRASQQWASLRQRLHDDFDPWLDQFQVELPDPETTLAPTLLKWVKDGPQSYGLEGQRTAQYGSITDDITEQPLLLSNHAPQGALVD